jgi:hypothetical protein
MMYRWCLVMASFDRYALSSSSVRLRNFAKVHVAYRVISVIVAIWFVLPVHILIFYNLRQGNCGILYSYAAALYHSLFTTITGSVLPVSLMATSTVLTRRNLMLKQQRREQNRNQPLEAEITVENMQRRRDQHIILMLFTQVLVYVVLITPLMGFYFYSAVSLNIPNKTADRVAIEKFVQFMGETIVYIFPSSSFYLYTMVSGTFRKELFKVVRLAKLCPQLNNNNRIEPITTDSTRRLTTGTHAFFTRMSQSFGSNQGALRRPTGTG